MRNKRFFLKFFLFACAYLMCALPAKADDPDWASMGAEVVANGQYYIYNVGQSGFLTESNKAGVLTSDLSQALCFTIEETTTDGSAQGVGYMKKLKYGDKKYANTPSGVWPSSSMMLGLKPLDGTNHHYTISKRMNDMTYGWRLQNFWYGSSATTIADTELLPNPSNTTYEWVFIPKLAVLAATVEAGEEYYIYNVGKQQFLKYEATTDQLGEAITFTVTASGTKFTFKCKHPETGATSYIRTNNATWSTGFGASGTACVLDNSSTTYNIIRQYASGPGEPMNNYYYSAQAASTSLTESLNDNSSDYSKWLFIPKASFDENVPLEDKEIDVEDEWTAIASTTTIKGDFAYLYNPASGCFLSKNGATANPGVTTDPEQAVMFYVRYSSSNRGFAYTDQAEMRYISSTTTSAATSVTYFTPIEKSTGRFQLHKDGSYMYVDKSGTKPAFAVGATPNQYSRWVFISRAAYVAKMAEIAAAAPTDKWLAKAVAPEDKGLYYIYNPVSKRFMGANGSLQAETAYPKQFQVNTSSGTISLAYDEGNGEGVKFAYITTSSWNYSEMYLTKAEKSTKSHYYTLAVMDASNKKQNKYIIAQKTGDANYRLNTILNEKDYYKYTTNTSNVINDDVWNEWLFIPAADFEAEFATAPTAEDVWTSHGATPEIGKKYFLYNVEAQKFFKLEHLTANTEEALLCTIGGEEEAKYISFINTLLQTNYVAAKAGYGYSTSSYILDWEETATDSKQYYIFHHPSEDFYNFNIHLTANKTYDGYSASAIKNGKRPDNLSGKHKWVFVEPVATLYYSASASIHEGQGDVYVYFDTPSILPSTGLESTGSLSSSVVKKATFMAVPDMEHGYQFLGWKADPDGDFISTVAMYEHPLTITSTDSEHPDDITLYAFFEKYDAIVYNQDGIATDSCATFAAAVTAASKGYTIKLQRNLSGQQTINKGVTIDFNGFTIRGAVDNLVIVSAPSTDTVKFVDNTIAGKGGISLIYPSETDAYTAIKVTAGTLLINSGNYIAQSYYFSDEAAPYILNRTGGKVRVNGGYFRSYELFRNGGDENIRERHIFNGSEIKLYGGFYTSNVENNLSNRVGTDMEVVGVTGIDPYAFTVQSALDESAVVATANDKKFASLADAIAYANNNAENTVVIRLAKDCQLEAGNYVIPEKATLIVPYSSLHTEPLISCPLLNNSKLPKQAYRTLTLANGVHIDVYGVIELGGCAYSYGNGATGTGRPNSDYGQMIMSQGSEIVLNNGANLRAWGFVTGEGTIDVRRGARVDEMFQVYDFKGGRGTLAMYENGTHKAFPMNQYYIQNVEAKTTFRPGSALYTTMAAVNVGISVKIIGVSTDDAALFMMDETDDSEDTWVRKWYNPATDQQVYDINNSAAISNLFLPLSAVTGVEGSDFNSKDYILPITNNFKIHVLSGQMDIKQDVAFLPGAELEIDKLCFGNIPDTATVYLYDSDEWGAYVYNGAYGSKIKYRPGGLQYNRNISSAAGLGDAKMNIHGTLEVDGGFRTTEGGANIFSTNVDAGTVSFKEHALTTYKADRDTLDTWTHQVYHAASADNNHHASADAYYTPLPAYPAQLQNAEGFTSTTTAAVGDNAGKSFCYINDQWRLMEDDGCMVTDGEGHYYIKPQEYVELSDKDEDANHLYHNIGNTRDFILTSDRDGNCQWWEVEDVAGHPDLKHSIHPENDVYYYHNGDEWVEKRFTIIWKNWDGAIIDTYEMKKGATLQYLGSTPNRERTAYYTYDFAGWSPAIAPDAVVSGDATYTAQFNQTDRKYIITFKNSDESVIETQYLRMGEIPECSDNTKPGDGKVWNPAISAVTGDASYKVADPSSSPYTIRFVNWDGTNLIDPQEVTAGEIPEYTGTTPIKPSLGDENYTFIGWTPDIAAAAADAIYVATFEAEHVTGLNVTNALTINDNREVDEVHVKTTGTLDIAAGKSLTTENFYLEASESASGQVLTQTGLTITGNVYFDLILNTPARHWHAFGVPWPIGNLDNVKLIADGTLLTLGRDYDIIWYDGAERATNGPGTNCWKYVEHNGKTLTPGVGYMIAFTRAVNKVRFTKASGASILYDGSVTLQAAGEGTNKGINAVANPMVYHANMNLNGVGQVHDGGEIGSDGYSEVTISGMNYIVGKTVYVQVDAEQTISVANSKISPAAAPVRRAARATDKKYLTLEDYYTVSLTNANGIGNKLYVLPEEDKENKYIIGHDLVKMGMSTKKAQIWINRYGANLGLNTTAPVDGVAEFPVNIYAPKAGQYTLSLVSEPDDEYTVYLTLDGEAIWNLSSSEYAVELAAGTNKSYGLRLSARKSPSVATGVDEAVVDAQGEIKKVIINDKVFIIRGNNVYSVDGQLVK